MFLTVPAEGWPTVVDATATDKRVSDELGGAIAVRVAANSKVGVFVREDCRKLPLNVPASYAISRAVARPIPVLGDVVIVGLNVEAVDIRLSRDDATFAYLGDVKPFKASTADYLAELAREGVCAKQGDWSKLPARSRDPEGKIRRIMIPTMIDLLRVIAEYLPEDYPNVFDLGDLSNIRI
jgi:hypothetical protein